MIFGDNEYLVVTMRAADSLRAALKQPTATEAQMRGLILALITDGKSCGQAVARPAGLFIRVRSRHLVLGWLDIVLSYAWDENRVAKVAPDGAKRVVFAIDVVTE